MTKQQRVRYDMFIRVIQFLQDNAATLTSAIIAAQLAILIAAVDRLQELLGEQEAGFSEAGFQFNDKGTAREVLRALLSLIAGTSHSMVYQFPGIDLKFRMPRNNGDTELLGKARSFLTEATPHRDDFISYGMEADFLTELQTAIDDFEGSLGAPGTAIDAHVEATEDIGGEIRKGMICVRTVDALVKNTFRSDAGKRAAWESAKHIEKVAVENPRPKPVTT
jgi:hypothetical protein